MVAISPAANTWAWEVDWRQSFTCMNPRSSVAKPDSCSQDAAEA